MCWISDKKPAPHLAEDDIPVFKLWHDSGERPKEKTYILIVHDYYNFGHDGTEMAYVKEDGRFVFKNLIYGNKWSDWAWKIKKWCYVDDILKIE